MDYWGKKTQNGISHTISDLVKITPHESEDFDLKQYLEQQNHKLQDSKWHENSQHARET